MLIIQKYGGSSISCPERIDNVARRIVETYKKGNRVAVVLSAPGDMTDELYEKAYQINPAPSKRELDMLLVTGEQQSVALMAMAIHKLGYSAISLNATQFGLSSTSNYGNARIKSINTERLNAELDKNNIVLIAGFQGVNRFGDMTTLGRGASDTTAVAVAAAMHADLCEIYSDVDGILTGDPRIVKNTRKLDEITYDEMMELASLGAKVLQNRSVEIAKKYRVNLVVRSSMNDSEGTIIKEVCKVEGMFVSSVATDLNVARISVVGIKDVPGMAFKLFSALAAAKISVDIILQSTGRNGNKDISFTVAKTDLNQALEIVKSNKEQIGFDSVSYDSDIAKLSVVGAGMASNPGVASVMFEALYDVGVNIDMISTSEIKISVLIHAKDVERAAASVHDKFMGFNVDSTR